MGQTDAILFPWYQRLIKPTEPTALLGFQKQKPFKGDCYDMALDNWGINRNWGLRKPYSSIICLRCAYFAKNPADFINRCANSLTAGGRLFVDFALGDHWRYKKFKVGWKKDGEHESAYAPDNYLWSAVWNERFVHDGNVARFAAECRRRGYRDLKKAVYDEVPSVITLETIEKRFDCTWHTLFTAKPYLQLYILICGTKK